MYTIDFTKPAHIYFVGIGGISMSGLAEILADAGFKVSGSDWKASDLTRGLEAKGINVAYGESADHITDDIDCAVLTSAVKSTNKEFTAIREKNIPYLSRAELLGQLMRNYKVSVAVSGTHGKTTTTSMISEILLEADTDPTLSIGGIYKTIGGNIRIGKSNYFVTEACEYTNSFLSFFPTVGLILNIEADHLDFFKDLQDIRNSFRKFAELLPAEGCLIINADIPNFEEISGGLPCKVITYSVSNTAADYYASDIATGEKGCPTFKAHSPNGTVRDIVLQVYGTHNVSNSLAALACADFLKIADTTSREALYNFGGTDRRFEFKGSIGGVNVIDDYAHHPTEIAATLESVKKYPHREATVVFQPHTYSRTKSLMDDFAAVLATAEKVILADIYAARETDTLGISSRDLQTAINALGGNCLYFPSFDEIENYILENCTKGDLLITMGAGDVHKIGENILGI